MKYFTSDYHLGEDRIGINGKLNLFYRPFKSIEEQNETILKEFLNSGFKDGDELWHLGDVVYSWENGGNANADFVLSTLKSHFPNSKFNLIVGNYDEDRLERLANYFDNIVSEALIAVGDNYVYLNHYPIKCKEKLDSLVSHGWNFSITGHIHGLWKVQKKMINVGVDAWHFKPISEEEIKFAMIACDQYYDANVFPY